MDIHNRDRKLIDSFLKAEGKVAEPLLIERLEDCEHCRVYFDQQIASNDEWVQAGQLLQPDDFDRATKYWYSAGSNAGAQVRQSAAIKEVLATLAPTDDPHRLGKLGKYEVMGVIGAGGMGVVLKAFESSLDRVVAIKVLAPHLASNNRARQRFEREARAAAAVINPNVIPIYSVNSDGKLPYLVMACIQGGSLQQRLDAQGAASTTEVLRIGSQIAAGLAAAHEQGLVHRDIKPENILFEGDVERVAITDFGLARAVDDNTVTQAGTIAGTPMYMSPEQARGEQVDQQSDLFSLGSVLYSLCTGQPPYHADSSLGVMRKITDEAPLPIRELNPDTPSWLARIIEKLMARDKAERFDSAAEVRELLENCLSHLQAPETVPLPMQLSALGNRSQESSHSVAAVALAGLLIGLLSALLLLMGPKQESPFSSSIVETAVRAAISKPEGTLTVDDLQQEIWRLDFRFTHVADKDLQEVVELKNVKEILFNHTAKITDMGLMEFAKLDRLEGLSLMETGITDQGLQHLSSLKNLSGLNLQKTQITSAGLNRLLALWNRPVDQEGDGACPLTYLLLDHCNKIDDEALVQISRLRNLKRLQLGSTGVTNAGLKCLESLKYLTSLDLEGTNVTKSGIAELQNSLIDCEISFDKTTAHLTGTPKKTFADLSDADLALIYQQITGAELAEGFVSGSDLASSVNILLGYDNISREKIAENLVKLGKPEVAKIVLSSGRVDPAATEALKLGDLLMESGNGAKAVDAWLNAYRIAPTLFDWKRIDTFDKHNRLKDLADVFSEERIRKTRSGTVTNMHFLLRRLMKDDVRASVGMPFMTRLWKARPDIRAWIVDETKWDEVPDRADYFAQLLIPENVEKVGNGWGAMFGGRVHGGWLFDLRKILDEPTTRELIARVKPKVEKHKSWVAGPALLAVLEALNGNCEPAKRFLKEKDNKHGMSWQHAEFLGLFLQGKDRELDGQIISLYESCLEERDPKSPYRASRVHELAKLYHMFGRKQDMLDLMYGLVDRDRKVEEFLVENWGNPQTVNLDHESIWDLRTAVDTLNSIGYPMDSLLLLSQVTFEHRRAAGVYKGGGWEYNDKRLDEVTSKSQKLLNANAIVEAINRGVIPIGLASTIDKETGEIKNPIVELLGQVASGELSNEVTAAFESVNAKLADAGAMDKHLAALMKQSPADIDVAVAAAIFAFLQDDIETAKGRLIVVSAISAADHKTAAADVNLHLAASKAVQHLETAELGRLLAKRAMQSGKQMNDKWKKFFQGNSLDKVDLSRLDHPVHSIHWSADGTQVATVSQDGLICVWTNDGQKLSETKTEPVNVPIYVFTKKLDRVGVVAAKDAVPLIRREGGGKATVYALPEGRVVSRFDCRAPRNESAVDNSEIYSVVFSPDEKQLVVAGSDESTGRGIATRKGLVSFWDVETGKKIRSSNEPNHPATALAYSEDGKLLAVGTSGWSGEGEKPGEILIWHTTNNHRHQLHSRFDAPLTIGTPEFAETFAVNQLLFAGQKLIARVQKGNQDGVGSWDLKTGKEHMYLMQPNAGDCSGLSPHGKLLSMIENKKATIYDAWSSDEIDIFRQPQAVTAVSFNPAGTFVAIGSEAGKVQLIELATSNSNK